MPARQHLENCLRLLLPPACGEHVLGDLQERCKSTRSYLIDGLSVLGPVTISRIRRTTDFQIFLMEDLTIYLSFTTMVWCLGQRSFLYDHAGLVRLVVPTVVSVVALLFCNAYSDPERKSFSKPILQSAGSISLALLGQAAAFDTQRASPCLFGSCLTAAYLALRSYKLYERYFYQSRGGRRWHGLISKSRFAILPIGALLLYIGSELASRAENRQLGKHPHADCCAINGQFRVCGTGLFTAADYRLRGQGGLEGAASQ